MQGEPGEVYEIEYRTEAGDEFLSGFFSKIWKKVTAPVRKVLSKVNVLRKKVLRSVTKSKYGRAVIRVGGAVLAPFTGGLSLAAAEGLSRYGKARYEQGMSRSSAWKRGAVGAAIGYAGGRAISYGYQQVMQKGVSGALQSAGSSIKSGFTSLTGGGTSTAAGTTAQSSTFFSKALSLAKTAGSFATKALPLITAAQGAGVLPGGAQQVAVEGAGELDYYGYGDPMYGLLGPGAGSGGGVEYAGGGGGGFEADYLPEELPEGWEETDGVVREKSSATPLLIVGGIAAGLFLFS